MRAWPPSTAATKPILGSQAWRSVLTTGTTRARFPLVGFAQADVGTPMQEMFDALDQAIAATPRSAEEEPGTDSDKGPDANTGGSSEASGD